MQKHKFLELIDPEILRDLLNKLFEVTQIRVAVLAYPSQEILVRTEFQRVCIDYHRANHETLYACYQSDKLIADSLRNKEDMGVSYCKNGLLDGAVPLIIEGEHLVSIFTGQVFTQEPDMDFFRQRAERYGFNVEDYLSAVKEIPIVSEEQFRSNLIFLKKLGTILAEIGLTNKKLIRSQEKIKNIQSIQKALLDNIPDIAWLKDKNSTFVAINEAFCESCGVPEDQIIGKTDFDFFPAHIAQTYINKDKEVMSSGKREIIEEPFVDAYGKEFVIESIKTPVYDENNEIIGTVGIARDVTERKRIQQDLANSKNNLEQIVDNQTSQLKESLKKLEELNLSLLEVNNHKNKFISNMSHELRTPLNAIIGFSDMLQGEHYGSMNELQKHYIGIIQDSASHLLNLINDILDLSKIDADSVALEIINIPPEEIVDPIVKMIKPQMVDKNLDLTICIDENVASVSADIRKAKQILLNILSNSIKFTMNFGKIDIKVEKIDDKYARFTISDTGIGIKEEDKKKIFTEFFQADDLKDINVTGAGIGLALSKRLIQLQHGEINFSSQWGKGSEFWFTLPLGPVYVQIYPADADIPLSSTPELNDYKILIAEDNPINMRLISDILNIHNYNYITAKNGLEAYQIALKEKPDMMLLDIKMPLMDGIQLVKKLREHEEFVRTPIYALTASAGEEAQKKHIEAGFTGQIDKPFTATKLLELINQNIHNKQES